MSVRTRSNGLYFRHGLDFRHDYHARGSLTKRSNTLIPVVAMSTLLVLVGLAIYFHVRH